MDTSVKRTQRDYTMAFKLAVVEQVEKGELSCPPNFVFQRSMVSIETGRMKSAEDSEAGVHG